MKTGRKYRRLGEDHIIWASVALPDAAVEDKKEGHQIIEPAARPIGRVQRDTDLPGIPSKVPGSRPTQDR